MNQLILPFTCLLVILLSGNCSQESDPIEKREFHISTRSQIVSDSIFVYNGLTYPLGTKLSTIDSNHLKIELPEGYNFISLRFNGSILISSIECFECQCTANGPRGCDVVYGSGGFNCDMFDPCTVCESRKVNCDNYAEEFITLAIISNDNFRFVDSFDDFASLSDFQIQDTLVEQSLFDSLGFDEIETYLFSSSYQNLSEPKDSVIAISAYGNRILIPVKPSWRNYVILDFDDDFYEKSIPIPGHDPSTVVTCECVRGPNPFDIVGYDCRLNMFSAINEYYRCGNFNCNFGCRMSLQIQ